MQSVKIKATNTISTVCETCNRQIVSQKIQAARMLVLRLEDSKEVLGLGFVKT